MSLLGFLLELKKDKVHFTDIKSEKILGVYEGKIVYYKEFVLGSGLGFLIRCNLDHT